MGGRAAGAGGVSGASGAAGLDGGPGPGGTPCPEAIRRALAAHTTMTLAYADEDGPQACAVLYATDGSVMTGANEVAGATDVAGGTGATDMTGATEVTGGTDMTDAAGAAGAVGGEAAGAGPALYFVTATTTRHGRALAKSGARVAFTAQQDGQEWSALTGLQGRGRCRVLAGAERAAGWRIYLERFPFVAASDRLRAALERTELWELRPNWLRLIDNGQGFGHKEEWSRS
ncbi:pyridoxamine 5'-phosphate oxidase [Streptomyces decoyicus]|uniref:Pyridoxamine 5'-phosphate oxidase n=1 Tax=Streptomyces decoyicus TaxID=249567 RepID=A0ABZ1FH79_9ACTN|nr:pyridoxamine 5'-phosphate oxidase [Streptomyces decoyicus]WSB69751.1 pyridoxamine 5'-phosphate oxidase [Streptomyces decoyicus]